MNWKRFSEEQIAGILKAHEAGVAVTDFCRRHWVSDTSIYKWPTNYDVLDVFGAKRLTQLEDINIKLKKHLTETMMTLLQKVVKPAGAVAHLIEDCEVSQRRAYRLLDCCHMTMRYQSVRPDDVVLRDCVKALSHER